MPATTISELLSLGFNITFLGFVTSSSFLNITFITVEEACFPFPISKYNSSKLSTLKFLNNLPSLEGVKKSGNVIFLLRNSFSKASFPLSI